MTRSSNHIHSFLYNIIDHHSPDFNSGLAKARWVIFALVSNCVPLYLMMRLLIDFQYSAVFCKLHFNDHLPGYRYSQYIYISYLYNEVPILVRWHIYIETGPWPLASKPAKTTWRRMTKCIGHLWSSSLCSSCSGMMLWWWYQVAHVCLAWRLYKCGSAGGDNIND